MGMFAVVDSECQIIAYHDYLDVVEKYIENVKKSHGDVDLHISKIKKKHVSLTGIEDLYLVRYADTYVQEGYMEYLALASDQFIYDYRYAKDILLKILEEYAELNNKDIKTLKKATKIVDRILRDSETYTPDLTELKNLKLDYDPYIYNFGAYNKY